MRLGAEFFSQSNEHEAHIPIPRKSAITGISQYVWINLGNLKLIKPAKLCSEVCCALDMTGYVYRKKDVDVFFFFSFPVIYLTYENKGGADQAAAV